MKTRPVMVQFSGSNTKGDWILTQITALIFFGDGDADRVKAKLLTDYYAEHLDGQEHYDIGGEG